MDRRDVEEISKTSDANPRGETVNVTYSEIRGREVYVYVRGRLVMKRWLDTGVSATFQVTPAGVQWSGPLPQSTSHEQERK
jgi:hypothetical protein